jgi:hypothetical protein
MASTNRTRVRTRAFALALVAAAPLAGAAACSSEAVTDQAAERIVESSGGGEVDIDSSEGRMEVTTEDGSFTAEAGGDLPDGWPADIPMPNEYTIETSSTMGSDAGTTQSVILRTTGMPDTVFASLEPELQSWTENSRTKSGVAADAFVMASYTKGDITLSLTATSGDGSDTVLSYTVTPAAS